MAKKKVLKYYETKAVTRFYVELLELINILSYTYISLVEH